MDPRVLELSLPTDEPWTVTDVTADIASAHERSKTEAAEKRQGREDSAIAALKATLPIQKSEAEEDKQHGIPRKAARQIIQARTGIDWILVGRGNKADPCILSRMDGENADNTIPNGKNGFENPIPAALAAEGRQESMFKNSSAASTSGAQNARCDSLHISPGVSGATRGKHFQDFEDLE